MGLAVLLSLVALEGFASLAGQSVVVRELLTTFGGNELVIGLVFGFWLAWVAAGAAVASRLVGRSASAAVPGDGRGQLRESAGGWRGEKATLALAAALGPALVAEFLLVRVVAGGLFTRPGELPNLLWTAAGSCLLLAPFSVLVGAFFPLAARSVARLVGTGKNAAALVYAAEAAGSLAGGLAFTFIFAGRVSHAALVALLAAALLALAAVASWRLEGTRRFDGTWRFGGGTRGRWRPAFAASAGAGAVVMLALAVFASGPVERATARRGGRVDASYAVVASRDTPYQHLLLVEREGQHVLFAGGEPSLTYEPADPGPWLAAHRALARARRLRRCLLIGFDPAAVRACLDQGAERVDVVEQDVGVTELVMPLLTPEDRARLEDERVHLYQADARRFVARSPMRYDFVMLGSRDPTSALVNRFFTREFFQSVAAAMPEMGVFTFLASSQANTLDGDALRYLRGLRRTARSVCLQMGHNRVGDHVDECVRVDDDDGSARFFAYRTNHPMGDTAGCSIECLKERMEERFPPLAPYFVAANLSPERSRKLNELTRPEPDTPVDTDMHPRAYLDFLRIWDRLSGSGARAWLRLADVAEFRHFMVLAGALLAAALLLSSPARSPRPAAVLVGALTGSFGMIVTVVLLLAYQNLHGRVYEAVGALAAAFMAGFAAGSLAARRLTERDPGGTGRRSICFAVAAETFGLVLVLLSARMVSSQDVLPHMGTVVFAVLLALAGASAGLELPLLAHWIAAGREGGASPEAVAEAAGVMDASDHAGAFAGAVLAGTLLVPALGVPGALLALAALRLASLAALGARAWRSE